MMFRLEFYKITKLRGSYLLFFVLGLLSKNREPAEKRLRTLIMQIYGIFDVTRPFHYNALSLDKELQRFVRVCFVCW